MEEKKSGGNKKIIYLTLGLIIALGLFLRVWNIDSAPPGIYPDEAVNGEDALRAAQENDWQWFYTANNGREGLYINFIAIFFKLFGVSFLTLKLTSIIFGTLTIWGTYLLTKELFKKESMALISAFLISVSFWAINFSRIGFRAIMLPAVLVFAFYFLWRGIRSKKFTNFAIGGFIFGIGLHTYIAFRIAPLILVFTLLALLWQQKSFFKNYWKQILIFALFVLISASPMLWTFLAHPEFLDSRSADVSILSPELNQGHLIKTFFRSFGLSLAKYNFWGDQNWRHNYPPYPVLNPIVGLAFLGGLFYFIWRFFSELGEKLFLKRSLKTFVISTFLLSWFFLMLAPEFMTAEGLPHALRSLGVMPVVYIFAALAFMFFLEKARSHTYIIQKIILMTTIASLVFIGVFNGIKYHVFWKNKKETAQSFEKNLIKISNYIKTVSPYKEIFVITGSMQRIPIKLLNHEALYIYYLYPDEIQNIEPKNPTYFEVILTEKNEEIIQKLQEKFSDLEFKEVTDSQDITFYILKK